jgi:hypothetical protein
MVKKVFQTSVSYFDCQRKHRTTAFKEYVDTGIPPTDLNPLLQAVNSIPVSIAECERAFSTMNIQEISTHVSA